MAADSQQRRHAASTSRGGWSISSIKTRATAAGAIERIDDVLPQFGIAALLRRLEQLLARLGSGFGVEKALSKLVRQIR